MKLSKTELKAYIKSTLVEESTEGASIKDQVIALQDQKKELMAKKSKMTTEKKADAITYKKEYDKWLEGKKAEQVADPSIKRQDFGDKYDSPVGLSKDYMAIYDRYKGKYSYNMQMIQRDINDVTSKIKNLKEQAKAEKAAAGGKVNVTVDNKIAHTILSQLIKDKKVSDSALRILGIDRDGYIQFGPQSSARGSLDHGYGPRGTWPNASDYFYSDYNVDRAEFVKEGNAKLTRMKKLIKTAIKQANTTDDLDAISKALDEVTAGQSSKDTQARETARRNRPMSDEEYAVANEMTSKYGNNY